jgi:septum formation protein
METILLSSSSPRRKEILESLTIPFKLVHPEIDETVFDHEIPEIRVLSLSREKAHKGEEIHSRFAPASGIRLSLGADTLVAFETGSGWKTLGKPNSREEAIDMLEYSSGKTQMVFSGISLYDIERNEFYSAVSTSFVRFELMTRKWIEWYADTGEWIGAAGAYRVQGCGSMFIEDMRGSWSGVMGLPIHELFDILTRARYRF